MNTRTLHINKPSEKLLSFVNVLRDNKDKAKMELRSKKDLYFSK